MIDWRDQRHSNRIKVTMVSPTNLEATYGELEGIDLSGSSLSAGYYVDSRTSGTLEVVGDGWVRGSFLRITHEIPEWDYSKVLGTYLVIDDGARKENGVWHYSMELQSTLYALVTEKAKSPWTLAKGSSAKNALHQILEACKRPYKDIGARDYKFSSPLVMESGQTIISRIFGITQPSNNRLDVDGKGYVTLSPYTVPNNKTPILEIDMHDARGIVHDGIERTTDWLQMSSEAVVAYKYSETKNKVTTQHEISGFAIVSPKHHTARGVRGFAVTDFRTVSDLNPKTKAQAEKLAKQYLNADMREHVEWNLTTQYLPIWEGDVVTLVINDGMEQYRGRRKCLVKNVEIDLQYMTMQLTLKETASGDDDD